MTTRRRFEISLFVCLLATTAVNAYLVLGHGIRSPASLRAGERFPALTEGSVLTGRWDRTQVVHRRIYYWFSPTCPYCRKNENSVAAVAKSVAPGELVGVSANVEGLKEYVSEHKISFPVLAIPTEAKMLAKLGPTPTTFIVNAKGIIEKTWVGAYADPARLEVEKYFGVMLPELGSDAVRITAVPVDAASGH